MNQILNRDALRPWALLPLRLVIGYGFLAHGLAKWNRGPANFGKLLHQIGAPLPTATAWMVTLLEIFGGLAILAGVLVTLVSLPLIISMLVAMVTVHLRYGFSSINTIGLTAAGPVFGPPGYEINLLYIAGLIALALAGPTALSVDRRLARFTSRRRQGAADTPSPAPPATAENPTPPPARTPSARTSASPAA